MNTFNALSEAKKPSESIENKVDKSQDLAQVLSDQWNAQPENDENSLDLDYLQKNHPSFVKYEFNSSDMEYLENIKGIFLENSDFATLQKIIWEIPQERTDLAEAIMFIYTRVQRSGSTK